MFIQKHRVRTTLFSSTYAQIFTCLKTHKKTFIISIFLFEMLKAKDFVNIWSAISRIRRRNWLQRFSLVCHRDPHLSDYPIIYPTLNFAMTIDDYATDCSTYKPLSHGTLTYVSTQLQRSRSPVAEPVCL